LQNQKPKDLRIVRGEDSRRSLVQAAINAVAQYGLAATTLNAVAEIAGVSRTLIGFHFSSKEQLLDAALENALDTYDKSLRKYLAQISSDSQTQVEGHILHDMHFAATHSELLSLWFANWGEVRATKKYRLNLLPIDNKYRNEITENLNNLFKDSHLSMQRAIMIDNFIYGVWLQCHLNPEGFDLEEHLLIAKNFNALVVTRC
jgi:TetR/AcrR family transcriptional regulator, transcriptional repressor of bet genes